MITGWRRYEIAQGGELDLNSSKYYLAGARGVPWESRELVASCDRTQYTFSPHSIPDLGGVSFYAYPFKDSLPEYYNNLTTDQVQCWNHLSMEEYNCSCGIYIVKTLPKMDEYKSMPILAQVSGWGAVEYKEKGWKVSHARIEALWIDSDSSRWLSNHYAPDYLELLFTGLKVKLEETYQVPVIIGVDELRKCACGRKHIMDYWKTKDEREYLVCEMETSHIVNAGKWLEKAYSVGRERKKWLDAFKDELSVRAAKKNEAGKTVIHF